MDRGYGHYLTWTSGKIPGIYASEQSKTQASELVADDVIANVNKYRFKDLLEDMAVFDISFSHKNDRSMAWMWTIMNSGKPQSAGAKKTNGGMVDVGKMFGLQKI